MLAAEAQHALLERAGGNPLYAEQFAELYSEQGSTDELGLPETLQGIIAARLDALPESEKSLLQDAAVVGKVFWASALATRADVATAFLHSLERKGFVRRQRRSSLEGESEFAFAHALVRDVRTARSREPTGRRSTGTSPSGWRVSGGPRTTRRCSRTTGARRSSSPEPPGATTTSSSRDAARPARCRRSRVRAQQLRRRLAYYEDALALWPDDEERPNLLFGWARALHLAYARAARAGLGRLATRSSMLGTSRPQRRPSRSSRMHFWYRGQGDLARSHVAPGRGAHRG